MALKNITEITRKEIAKLFKFGYTDNTNFLWDSKYNSPDDGKIFYVYHGELEELDFLKILYPLDIMPSYDSRFPNAEGEIWQHTINNDDYEYGWVFTDDRFGLNNGDDVILLKFLCTVFHPTYRKEEGYWKEYLDKIQDLIRKDGYELYISKYISGREVYEWRELTEAEVKAKTFIPFSQRYKDTNITVPKITKAKRHQLDELMTQKESIENLDTETGYNYQLTTRKAVVEDIKIFYIPKAYDDNGSYIQEEDFDRLVLNSSPKTVFDIIELYAEYNDTDFENEINTILDGLNYKLVDGKMMMQTTVEVKAIETKEPDLKELIHIAEINFRKGDLDSKQIALEKIWDALEKLKTYYSDKKLSSLNKVLDKVSNGNENLRMILDKEFRELTDIGNTHQIRHFETGKIAIKDVRMKEYWYMRCLALINLAIKYIEE
ncbi:hypothetical protein H6B13_06390 [Bacteroides gallinaceum]|uniref:AbiJ-related protein n=1 Tax=Bacteroides gallinaceum TaxID=1462571 RepID=UPI00195E6C1A|nr:hypothetical protein [Bacteroides gallinaceum]MBM6719276.1 hypothetical protein [Bacteroides gallinaceum]